jgi:hypothetical protein
VRVATEMAGGGGAPAAARGGGGGGGVSARRGKPLGFYRRDLTGDVVVTTEMPP